MKHSFQNRIECAFCTRNARSFVAPEFSSTSFLWTAILLHLCASVHEKHDQFWSCLSVPSGPEISFTQLCEHPHCIICLPRLWEARSAPSSPKFLRHRLLWIRTPVFHGALFMISESFLSFQKSRWLNFCELVACVVIFFPSTEKHDQWDRVQKSRGISCYEYTHPYVIVPKSWNVRSVQSISILKIRERLCAIVFVNALLAMSYLQCLTCIVTFFVSICLTCNVLLDSSSLLCLACNVALSYLQCLTFFSIM